MRSVRSAFLSLAGAIMLASAAISRLVEQMITSAFAWLAQPISHSWLPGLADQLADPRLALAGPAPHVERHEAGHCRRAAARGI